MYLNLSLDEPSTKNRGDEGARRRGHELDGILLVDHVATLREAVAATRRSHPFTIDAFVVLPDHLHAIWKMPPGDCDFSTLRCLIKSRFARELPMLERLSAVRVAVAVLGALVRAGADCARATSNTAASIR